MPKVQDLNALEIKPIIEKNTEESIVLSLLNLADTIIKYGDTVCHKMGITTQQWLIMLHIAQDPNIPMLNCGEARKPIVASQLADMMNVSRPNITNLINSLIDKGLVQQVEVKKDRRKKFLLLTPEGLEVVNAIEPIRRMANRRLLEKLNTEQRNQFLTFINSCLSILHSDFTPSSSSGSE